MRRRIRPGAKPRLFEFGHSLGIVKRLNPFQWFFAADLSRRLRNSYVLRNPRFGPSRGEVLLILSPLRLPISPSGLFESSVRFSMYSTLTRTEGGKPIQLGECPERAPRDCLCPVLSIILDAKYLGIRTPYRRPQIVICGFPNDAGALAHFIVLLIGLGRRLPPFTRTRGCVQIWAQSK
jgi:hypothetical protein